MRFSLTKIGYTVVDSCTSVRVPDWRADRASGRRGGGPTSNSYIFEQQKYSSRPIWSALSVAPAGGYASPQLSARYRNNGWKWGAKRGDEWGRHLTGWELHSCWSGPSQRVVFANDTLLKNAGQSKHTGAARERRSSAANSVRIQQGCRQYYFQWCDCTSLNVFLLPVQRINSLWHYFGIASEHTQSLTANRSRVRERVFCGGDNGWVGFSTPCLFPPQSVTVKYTSRLRSSLWSRHPWGPGSGCREEDRCQNTYPWL